MLPKIDFVDRPGSNHRAARFAALGAAVASLLGATTAQAAGAPPEPAFYTWQAPGGGTTAGHRVIALTFDDGPGPFTPKVLSVLEGYGVPATFFEIGENVTEYPQYTKMVVSAGYPVEDHTWSHPDLATLPAAQVDAQIARTQQAIRSLTGETPACVRPPDDIWDSTVLGQITGAGLTAMSYSIDPRDWSMPGVTAIVSRVLGAAFPGGVVDLHDGGGTRSETVAALPKIIIGLRAKGYGFVSICGSRATSPRQTSAVYAFGHAPAPGTPTASDTPFAGAAGSSDGYWLAESGGGVVANGVPFYGSMGGKHLSEPIVGMAATPDGHGYWLVAAGGGIFGFGDARSYGSMGGKHLSRPIVGMATDTATGGYWEVAADGGVFSFHAPFYGSMGGRATGDRFFAIVASPGGGGYLVVGQHRAAPR